MPSINAGRLQEFDWSESPLGDRKGWSAEQNANIEMLMASDFPMCSVWGSDLIQIYNDGYNAIFGPKHPASFGAPARESWTEIWEFLSSALDEVKAGKTMWFAETLLPLARSSAPEECYFDFSYSPIRGRDGRVEGALSVAVERTAEVVLRRRQKLLQLDAARGPDDSFDALTRILHDVLVGNEMDCKVAALFSVASESRAPDGEIWTVRADQDLVRHLRPLAANALRSGAIKAGDGRSTDAATQAVSIPFFTLEGEPCCALVIIPSELVPFEASFLPFVEMISRSMHAALHAAERRDREIGQMRERIAEQDQVYQFLFDNIQDGIAYCATTGAPGDDEIVLAVNPRLGDMLGYHPAEVVGMSRDAFFFPSDVALTAALEKRGRELGFRGELELCLKDGRHIPVEVSSNLVEFRKGQTRSLTLIRDISHHKQAEIERTERVRIETIANLAGALAHDTNNLMTIVIGSAEMLADSLPKGGAEHQMAVNAMVAAERACGLTNQLLTYSRRQPPAARPTDLNAFLEEVRPLVKSALGEINTLTIKPGAGLPLCLADPVQLTTAVLNLASNARHAMPDGGTFEMESCRLEFSGSAPGSRRSDRGLVGLRVTDNGTGISPEIQSRIFEPFFTTKAPGTGSGLGLSIVRRLLEELEGTLHMESIPGRGTTFELGFQPVEPTDQDETCACDGWAEGDIVLYVEDNGTVRRQTEAMLRQMGANTIAFSSARKAVEWVKLGGRAAFLLSDLVLPGGMSGLEMATAIRRHQPDLPVLITTGYDPIGPNAQEGHGHFPVLQKPYTRRSLEAAMQQQRRLTR